MVIMAASCNAKPRREYLDESNVLDTREEALADFLQEHLSKRAISSFST